MKNSNLILLIATLLLSGCSFGTQSKPVQYSPSTTSTRVDPNKLCHSNPQVCDTKTLCIKAVRNGAWDMSETFYPHVKEAKKRGLTCGVRIANSSNATPSSSNASIPRTLGKTLRAGINRLVQLGSINSGEKQRLQDKLKEISQSDYAKMTRICTKAFEQIEPQKCDRELMKHID